MISLVRYHMLELTTSTSLAVQGKTPLTGITIRNFSAKAIKHRRHRLPSRLPSNLAMHYFGSASAHVRTAPEKNLVRVLRRRNQKRHPLTRNQLSSDISTIATDDDNDARQALLQPRQQRALCRQKLTRTERQRLHRAGRVECGLDAPLPWLHCDPSLPARRLEFDNWTQLSAQPSAEEIAERNTAFKRGRCIAPTKQPLPPDAEINFHTRSARVPAEFPITFRPECFLFGLPGTHADSSLPLPDRAYVIADVTANTLVARLSADIECWLRAQWAQSILLQRTACNRNLKVQLWRRTGPLDDVVDGCYGTRSTLVLLYPEKSMRDEDVFNQRDRLCVTIENVMPPADYILPAAMTTEKIMGSMLQSKKRSNETILSMIGPPSAPPSPPGVASPRPILPPIAPLSCATKLTPEKTASSRMLSRLTEFTTSMSATFSQISRQTQSKLSIAKPAAFLATVANESAVVKSSSAATTKPAVACTSILASSAIAASFPAVAAVANSAVASAELENSQTAQLVTPTLVRQLTFCLPSGSSLTAEPGAMPVTKAKAEVESAVVAVMTATIAKAAADVRAVSQAAAVLRATTLNEGKDGKVRAVDVFKQGTAVFYEDKQSGDMLEATVCKVHHSDDTPLSNSDPNANPNPNPDPDPNPNHNPNPNPYQVHFDDTPPYYSVRLASGQERETVRERLWRKAEPAPVATDRATFVANPSGTAPIDCSASVLIHPDVSFPELTLESPSTSPPPSPLPSPAQPRAMVHEQQLLGRLQLDRTYAQHAAYTQRRNANRPEKPEHIQMLNNLLADRGSQCSANLNLPTSHHDYRKLNSHINQIKAIPVEVCFNCAFMMHPSKNNRFKLALDSTTIRSHNDCRAYRVARHYIDDLAQRVHAEDLDNEDENDDQIAKLNNVFCCQPCSDGLHIEVFACSACRHEAAQLSSHNLFDGVAADGSFTSCGVGEPEPPVLAALNVHERLALSVLQMADASFSAYAGYGYMNYTGGAMLTSADYTGAAVLLASNPSNDSTAQWGRYTVDEQRMRAALDWMRNPQHCNPLVRSLLTCLERELQHGTPYDAGTAGGMAMLAEEDANNRDDGAPTENVTGNTRPQPTIAGLTLDPPARQLQQQPFTGVFQGMDPLDPAATLQQNGIHRHVAGTAQQRTANTAETVPIVANSVSRSTEAMLHPTLYPTSLGGHTREPNACDHDHFRKIRLGGVARKFAHKEEYIWSVYQTMIKKCFHRGGPRLANANVVAAGTGATVRAHELMHGANPDLQRHVTSEESFTGGVAKTIVGSKGYWKKAFVELMAMACAHGIPAFFLTFTANESGWADVTSATQGVAYARRPVETTRQYNHRWTEFKSRFLRGKSPLGEITHTWHRQEDQARGSLHVHMAIWVKEGTENPDAIRATAPRGDNIQDPTAGLTPAQLAWRTFVTNVQRHDCYEPKCHFKKGTQPVDSLQHITLHDSTTAVARCSSQLPFHHATTHTPSFSVP